MTTLGVWGSSCLDCAMKKNVNIVVKGISMHEAYFIKNIMTSSSRGVAKQTRIYTKRHCDRFDLIEVNSCLFANTESMVKYMIDRCDFFILFLKNPFLDRFAYRRIINYAIERRCRLIVVDLVIYKYD